MHNTVASIISRYPEFVVVVVLCEHEYHTIDSILYTITMPLQSRLVLHIHDTVQDLSTTTIGKKEKCLYIYGYLILDGPHY